MDPTQIITLISALGGSAIIGAVLDYFRNRKKLKAEGRVAESTASSQIGLVSVQELEAKLGYLNRVISVLEQHNVRLEADLDQGYELNTRLNQRVRELADRCDSLERAVRKLCSENDLDPDKYLGVG